MVLVFKTTFMLQDNGTEVVKEVETSDGDLPKLLTSTKTGQKIGAPIVGMMFQVRDFCTSTMRVIEEKPY